MPKGVYARKSEEERFWEKVDVGEDTECWPWTACSDVDGYGWFSYKSVMATQKNKTVMAHRYSAQLKFGDLGDKLVRHTCDNRTCVNPSHLILGTPADNSADMIERNRQARGEKAPSAVLTDEQARQILLRYKEDKDAGKVYGSLERIAKDFKVSKQSVYRITSRQSYKHLEI